MRIVRRQRRPAGAITPRGALCLVLVVAIVTAIQVVPGMTFGVPQPAPRPAGEPPRNTKIEVWGWNIAGQALGLLEPEFERTHPDSDLVLKVVGTQMQSRFILALTSGRGAPDVMQLQEREAGRYTRTGRLADITQWAAKYEHDFPPSFWDSCVVDGKVYALPWDIAPCAVFYKRWIFEQYGIDPESIETWDDLIAAGKRIGELSHGKTKMMPLAPNATAAFFTMLLQEDGGAFFDADGRIVFDNPRNLETLDLIRKLLDSGITTPIFDQQELNTSYNDDSVACYPAASWNMDNMKVSAKSSAGKWGVFRLPAFRPGGLRNSNQGGSVLVLPAQSDHVEASFRFLEYALCTVEGQLKQYKEKGLFPAYIPATKDPRFDEPDPFFGGQHVAKLFAQDFDKVTPMIRTRDWMEAESIVNQAIYEWYRDRQDSQMWLRKTAKLIAARLGREVAQ